MQSDNGVRGVKMLELEMQVPEPGDEVLVLGYPLGLSGIIGRTSLEYLSDTNETNLDYWEMGDKLAHEGHIKPLVSKGIVSQVTEKYIVYDAETTLGGSGGPVLDLHGKVVAVNTAVMREFGGSNLGIPAAHVAELLARISSQPD
jgi:S1-C subfamily serine protease